MSDIQFMALSRAYLVCSSSFWSTSRPFSVMLFLAALTAAFSLILSEEVFKLLMVGETEERVHTWFDFLFLN